MQGGDARRQYSDLMRQLEADVMLWKDRDKCLKHALEDSYTLAIGFNAASQMRSG